MTGSGKLLFQVVTSDEVPKLQVTSGIRKAGDRLIKNMMFNPQNNITTFELAQCLGLILTSMRQATMITEEDIDALGDASRHFKDA